MVVSEGREFLVGEEMANILVIKINIKNLNIKNGSFEVSMTQAVSFVVFAFLLSIHEFVAVILPIALLQFFVQKA